MTTPEQQRHAEVKTGSIEQAAAERASELLRSKEASGERVDESETAHTLEKARVEANAEAISGKEHAAGEHHRPPTDHSPVITSADRKHSYNQTMQRIRQEMPGPARTFSKVIHNPVVERVSDAVGSTVARPNAILSGSICAFIFVLALYINAKHIGYSLTGFETIGSFVLGWAIGIAIDMVRSLFRR